MKLENITIEDNQSRKAVDLLPEGVIDKEIKGNICFCEGHEKPLFQIRMKSNFYSLNAPEGSTNFRQTFEEINSYTSFVYKGNEYVFINQKKK